MKSVPQAVPSAVGSQYAQIGDTVCVFCEPGGSCLLEPCLQNVPVSGLNHPRTDGYITQTFECGPSLLGLGPLLGIAENDLLAGLPSVMSLDPIERLVAYRDRYYLRYRLQNETAKENTKLTNWETLTPHSSQRLGRALATNFGIADSWLNPGTEFVMNFEMATNRWSYLVLVHKNNGSIDGIDVNGRRPAEATGSPYEQYLGAFEEDPITIGSVKAKHTVVASNAIKAFSLLSVPELTSAIRVVVSGVSQLERVAVRTLERPHPITLIEYGSGRRCSRHRKLRELLEAGSGKPVNKLCPSDLRLSVVRLLSNKTPATLL